MAYTPRKKCIVFFAYRMARKTKCYTSKPMDGFDIMRMIYATNGDCMSMMELYTQILEEDKLEQQRFIAFRELGRREYTYHVFDENLIMSHWRWPFEKPYPAGMIAWPNDDRDHKGLLRKTGMP